MDLITALIAIVGSLVAIVALEIVLDYAWFLVQRAWTHKEAGRHQEAQADFDRAVKLKPKYKWAIALGGWLTLGFSRRRYLTVSLVLFVGFSLACAVAWDLPSLMVFRTVQGFISGTFTYSVLSFAATENIKKEQANDATAIYNILRTIATITANASIGTLLTKREQFHSNVIVETVSSYNHQTQARLQQLSQFFTSKMGNPIAAQSQALKSIQQSVSQQSYIIAYSDCFYFIGVIVILGGIISIPFLKVKKPGEHAS